MTPVEKKAQNEAANRAGQKAELAPKSIDKPAKSTPDDDDGSLDQVERVRGLRVASRSVVLGARHTYPTRIPPHTQSRRF